VTYYNALILVEAIAWVGFSFCCLMLITEVAIYIAPPDVTKLGIGELEPSAPRVHQKRAA